MRVVSVVFCLSVVPALFAIGSFAAAKYLARRHRLNALIIETSLCKREVVKKIEAGITKTKIVLFTIAILAGIAAKVATSRAPRRLFLLDG